MKPQQPSTAVPLALMAAILLFGVGSAYLVLRQPTTIAAETETVEQAATAAEMAASKEAFAASGALPVSPATAAPAETPAASATPPSPTPAADPAKQSAKAAKAVRTEPRMEPKLAKAEPKADKPAEQAEQKSLKGANPIASGFRSTSGVRIIDSRSPVGAPLNTTPEGRAASKPEAKEKPATVESATSAASAAAAASSGPSVVASNATQVWIRVNDQSTRSWSVGEYVPGFGVYKGVAGGQPRFDNSGKPAAFEGDSK